MNAHKFAWLILAFLLVLAACQSNPPAVLTAVVTETAVAQPTVAQPTTTTQATATAVPPTSTP